MSSTARAHGSQHPRGALRELLRHLESRGVASTARAVCAALWTHADPWGRCWPSQGTLARLAGCCERTVRTGLRALERAGVLLRDVPRLAERRRTRRTTAYRFTFGAWRTDATRPGPVRAAGRPELPAAPANGRDEGHQVNAPEVDGVEAPQVDAPQVDAPGDVHPELPPGDEAARAPQVDAAPEHEGPARVGVASVCVEHAPELPRVDVEGHQGARDEGPVDGAALRGEGARNREGLLDSADATPVDGAAAEAAAEAVGEGAPQGEGAAVSALMASAVSALAAPPSSPATGAGRSPATGAARRSQGENLSAPAAPRVPPRPPPRPVAPSRPAPSARTPVTLAAVLARCSALAAPAPRWPVAAAAAPSSPARWTTDRPPASTPPGGPPRSAAG